MTDWLGWGAVDEVFGGAERSSRNQEQWNRYRDLGTGQPQKRGPKGWQRSDERVKEDICEQLMLCSSVDSSEVTVEVQSGKVTLEGTVPERRMKHAIEDIADNCAGVEDVENRVRVSRGGSGSEGEASTGATPSSSTSSPYAGGSSSLSSKKG